MKIISFIIVHFIFLKGLYEVKFFNTRLYIKLIFLLYICIFFMIGVMKFKRKDPPRIVKLCSFELQL